MYQIRNKRVRAFQWMAMVCIIFSLIVTGYSTQIVRAEGPNYATLIVVFGPDDIYSSRISFNETEISGSELLVRSGLTVLTQAVAGLGVTVCKIDGTGCDFPGEACFCQCLGSPCNYWSYWTWQNGSWIYAGRGASQSMVRTGDINAWVWGDGQTPPPAISAAGALETVLPSLTVTNTPVPPQIAPSGSPYPSGSETAIIIPVNTETYPEPGTPTLEPSANPVNTVTETQTESETGTVAATQTQPSTPTNASASATPAPSRASTAQPNSTITPDRSASVIAKVATNRSLTGVPTVAPAAAEKRSYWAFAGIALLLLLAIAYVLLLRRQRARSK